jgi:hypothetical protein
MPEKSDLHLYRCALTATLRCNLKCKLCITYSPYYENPPHYDLATLNRGIDEFFKTVGSVGNFVISGGDPLLQKALPGVVERLCEKYYGRVSKIEIITNGSILPTNSLLKVCARYAKIAFLVDNYGENLSRRVDEISAALSRHNIKHSVRKYCGDDAHMGGWVDFSDLELKYPTGAEREARFSKCAQIQKFNSCFPFPIVGGKLFPCPALRRCVELGKVPESRSEVLDLFDETLSQEYRRNWFENLKSIKSLSACAYCHGMCDDSPRRPPAEQL